MSLTPNTEDKVLRILALCVIHLDAGRRLEPESQVHRELDAAVHDAAAEVCSNDAQA